MVRCAVSGSRRTQHLERHHHHRRLAFWECIQDLASKQTRSRLTEAELEEEYRWKFAPAHYVGRQKFYRMIRPEPRRHAALDGLTIREYEERAASEILHDTPPDIHESFQLDRS